MSLSLQQGNVRKASAWLLLGVLGGLGLDLCAKEFLRSYALTEFVLLRSLFAIGAMFGFFYGLARMPLVVAGFLIWDEVPDRWVVAGALIIIASGIFVVYRGRN